MLEHVQRRYDESRVAGRADPARVDLIASAGPLYRLATCAIATTTSVIEPSRLNGARRASTSRSIASALFPSTSGEDDENVKTRRATSCTLISWQVSTL